MAEQRNWTIAKSRLFYFVIVMVLYVNTFEILIRGVARNVMPPLEVIAATGMNFLDYILPLFLAFMGAVDRRFLLVLGLAVFFIVLYPLRIYGDVFSYFLEFRLYIFLLFYLPIIKYVLKFEGFDRKLFKHCMNVLWLFTIWGALEVMTIIFYPEMALIMKSFAVNPEQTQVLSRPLGLALDYQTGAFAIALLCLIYLLRGRYLVYGMILVLSGLINMKTWFSAAVITSALVFITRFNVRYVLALAFVVVLSLAGLFETFFYIMGGKSGSVEIMLNLFLRDQQFLISQTGIIVPNGLVRMGASPLGDVATQGLPEQFTVNEIAIVRILFQLGFVGTIWWLYLVYAPLFHKWYNFYKNDYLILLFFSTIGLVHQLTLLKPFIIIMLLFFGLQATKERKMMG